MHRGEEKGEDGHLQAKERLEEPSQGASPAHTLDCSLQPPELKPSISNYLTLSVMLGFPSPSRLIGWPTRAVSWTLGTRAGGRAASGCGAATLASTGG